MLKDLQIGKSVFAATSENLLEQFYIPALNNSNRYCRGVAFFSIEFLINLMDPIVDFIFRGGKIQLVTSVRLDMPTIESFAHGYMLNEKDIEERLLQSISNYQDCSGNKDEVKDAKLDVIANLIASDRLQIKVAYAPKGIYHEKIGVFLDANGDAVSFIGSANETINAYVNNYETINIFSSRSAPEIVSEHIKHFEQLWGNEIEHLVVLEFPSAVKGRFLEEFQKSESVHPALERLAQLLSSRPDGLSRCKTARDYQVEAIEAFANNSYCLFFSMATGTGKTFTAVKAIERMAKLFHKLAVVILVPQVDLQVQWRHEIENNLDYENEIIQFGGGHEKNFTSFNLRIQLASFGHDKAHIALCVYDTFFSKYSSVKTNVPTLVVVDEAHNLTPQQLTALKNLSFMYRLGLSATPQRYDACETEAILNYFGGREKSYVYSLEKAIDKGVLAHYDYHVILVEMTPEEETEYNRLTRYLTILENSNTATLDDIQQVRLRRSLVVKKAQNKINALRLMVHDNTYDFRNSVVYCGQGSSDGEELIIDQVTKILGSQEEGGRYKVDSFTSSTPDRKAVLSSFKNGDLDTLVAIRCFDEGVDVPALEKLYIMASDSLQRQTIQRRGRVLRICHDTKKDKAQIYDFVVCRLEEGELTPLKTELARVKEYSRMADNSAETASLFEGIEGSDDLELD